MSRVFVVGSINVDLVARADRQPRPGETLVGMEFATHPGGKGANQAVAAARLGAETWMVGRVGDDGFGGEQMAFLGAQGLRVEHVVRTEGVATGVALIVVASDGENSIVVVPGANGRVEPDDVVADFSEGDVVVCQFEIPLPTVAAVLGRARAAGATTILNAAPSLPGGASSLGCADVLVVNESELAYLAERPEPNPSDTAAVFAGLRAARTDSSQTVVATLGGHGVVALAGHREIILAGHPARVVDTTAAGDTFVGALAARTAAGDDLEGALSYANLAASICVERAGAGPSIPTAAEVACRVGDVG
ncbi:MAG: ribokinase [Candidatus Binatia bacterium]|nr:ribokinase [Candidatus Binatia bacterium]